ncbi:helix-turn-helix domain-containing protein [Novosphingobium sp. AP12]|uniref:helix-turn-helix domain-containing protein n=1 Tax=Novosphingobium sp. AP12 TaxID=1144305 RepID=UPI000271E23C|nr:helix-turn-helix domain-containing protein [Novosphingobium sp. AP12]EJL31620.1 DNA-binding domain-containing protein, AraC-type [Novosphingobium sp. AP12]
MPHIAFDIEQFTPSTRMSAWCDILDKFALHPQFAETPGRLCGRIDHIYSARGIGFSMMEAQPHRLASATERAGEDIFFLSIVPEGHASVEIEGRPVELSRGDILYGKRGAVGAIEMHTPFKFLNVNMSAAVLERAALVDLPTSLVHLRGDTATTRVLAAMLFEVARSLDRLDEAGMSAIESAIIRLLVNSVFEGTGANPLGGLASVRANVLRRIWQTIDAHLHDDRLSLASVAEEHALTPRYVQKLFEESGRSFRTFVRERRLDKCRTDLANPVNANLSIAAICLHWGFYDGAAFSRAFRDAYGCTPTAFRRDALEGRVAPRGRLHGMAMGSA